jgi:hypothetical protein
MFDNLTNEQLLVLAHILNESSDFLSSLASFFEEVTGVEEIRLRHSQQMVAGTHASVAAAMDRRSRNHV